MNTNNITYSKEIGVIRMMLIVILNEKAKDTDKNKAWKIINQVSNKYIVKVPKKPTKKETQPFNISDWVKEDLFDHTMNRDSGEINLDVLKQQKMSEKDLPDLPYVLDETYKKGLQ